MRRAFSSANTTRSLPLSLNYFANATLGRLQFDVLLLILKSTEQDVGNFDKINHAYSYSGTYVFDIRSFEKGHIPAHKSC